MNYQCLSGSVSCEAICDTCKKSCEETYQKTVDTEVTKAVRLLRSHGYCVIEPGNFVRVK
jgi:hypothetical protein